MTTLPVEMVELESTLRTDASGSQRDALGRRLQEQLAELKRQMDAGMPPDDFAAAGKLKASLETAISLVPRVWSTLHRSSP